MSGMHAMLAGVNLESPFIWMAGVAIVAIIAGVINSALRTQARERTRREIAAYIAEGSMSPDEGERLMRAQPDEDA